MSKILPQKTLRGKKKAIKRKAMDFFSSPVAGGIVLLVCTLIALVLANLPATKDLYHRVLLSHFTVGFEGFALSRSLEHWINDGLMVVFFFVVGLEIKREIIAGELSSFKKAALPIVAAIGGMVFPALIYLFFNAGTPAESGWGIPMATDIAFALGILFLMGDKAPMSLKVFLTALAIVDDLGAIVVIAVFYSSQLDFVMLGWAAVTLVYLLVLNKLNVRKVRYYLIPSIIIWILFLNSGVHATIAGVLIAFAIPSTPLLSKKGFVLGLKRREVEFVRADRPGVGVLSNPEQHHVLENLRRLAQRAIPPSQRLEYALHQTVSYFIMPLFALANAGVTVSSSDWAALVSHQGLGIIFGLVVGKPLGIFLLCWLTVKLGLGMLPKDSNWKTLFAVGCFGGIGFTMSMFINNLAFMDPQRIAYGKMSILAASLLAGFLGWAVMSLSARKPLKTE